MPKAIQPHDVAIVSCFSESIYLRPYMVARYFKQAGFSPVILTMQFSHVHKKKITHEEAGCLFIPVPGYKSNISLRRILSHIVFSIRAARRVRGMRPKIVYICCPPNSSAFFGVRAARKIGARIIVDVLDVWPEAMPFPPRMKKLLDRTAGIPWRWMRNWGMERADYCLSENASFPKIIGKAKIDCEVVYLSRDARVIEKKLMQVPDSRVLRIAYLGNINNIGDFDSLVRLCTMIERYQVQVEIIGEGENRAHLLAELDRLGIAYTYHGVLYLEEEKQPILAACDFGFNGYKQETVVALSYKSVEYFAKGVPLINSAKPDTWEIVEKWQAGLNYDAHDLEKTAEHINGLDRKALWKMRLQARKVYETLFAFDPYREKMDQILSDIIDGPELPA